VRILVDGFNLALEKGTGVATYARNLTHCLKDMGHEVDVLFGIRGAPGKSPLMREVSFFDQFGGAPESSGRLRRLAGAMLNPAPRTAYPIKPTGAVIYRQFASKLPYYDTLWNSPGLFDIAHTRFRAYKASLAVRSPHGVEIAHWTYPMPVKHKTALNIYTLHDLVPLRLPYTTLDKKSFYYRLLKHIVTHADHIVTVSEASKKDIVDILGVAEEKVSNTYQSVFIPQRYLDKREDVLRDEIFGVYRLKHKQYFLFYGSIEPKKNVARIIEAYLAAGLAMPLVVVGAQAWKSERELKLLDAFGTAPREKAEAEGPKSRIMHFDYVSFPQLVDLIRGARAVLFPSLYEGFGLPILEGMLCETPVITSNFGSMSEIAGGACLLADPYDTHEIKGAIVAAASDDELCAAKVARGKIAAQRYSAEAHQRRLGEVYEKVICAVKRRA
jgi:glycosyltransferase involved in cell wall biosynthesis